MKAEKTRRYYQFKIEKEEYLARRREKSQRERETFLERQLAQRRRFASSQMDFRTAIALQGKQDHMSSQSPRSVPGKTSPGAQTPEPILAIQPLHDTTRDPSMMQTTLDSFKRKA